MPVVGFAAPGGCPQGVWPIVALLAILPILVVGLHVLGGVGVVLRWLMAPRSAVVLANKGCSVLNLWRRRLCGSQVWPGDQQRCRALSDVCQLLSSCWCCSVWCVWLFLYPVLSLGAAGFLGGVGGVGTYCAFLVSGGCVEDAVAVLADNPVGGVEAGICDGLAPGFLIASVDEGNLREPVSSTHPPLSCGGALCFSWR